MRLLIAVLVATSIVVANQRGFLGEPWFADDAVPQSGAYPFEEDSLETPTGTLYGTLTMPVGNGPFPVVLIIAGSGQTDRNGNSDGLSGTINCLQLLAEGLAEGGFASLRYDKRGVGKSTPARAVHNTFDVQVDDAVLWSQRLAKSPRFNGVSIAGHSEGALIGALVAQRGWATAVISLAGGTKPMDATILAQMTAAAKAGQIKLAAVDALRDAFAELRAGRTIAEKPGALPAALWNGLFAPRAQDYLMSIFRYDPAVELAALRVKGVRLLMVRGTTDLQGSVNETTALAAAVGVAPVIIEGMSHDLKTAPLDPDANSEASENPRNPLAPGLLPAVLRFLKG